MSNDRSLRVALQRFFHAGEVSPAEYTRVQEEYRDLTSGAITPFDGFKQLDVDLLTQLIEAATVYETRSLPEQYGRLATRGRIFPTYTFWEEIGTHNEELSQMQAARRQQAREARQQADLGHFTTMFEEGLRDARIPPQHARARARQYAAIAESLPLTSVEIVGRIVVAHQVSNLGHVGLQRDLLLYYCPEKFSSQAPENGLLPDSMAFSLSKELIGATVFALENRNQIEKRTLRDSLRQMRLFLLDYPDSDSSHYVSQNNPSSQSFSHTLIRGKSWQLGAVLASIYVALVRSHFPMHLTPLRPLFVPWTGTGSVSDNHPFNIKKVSFLYQKMRACTHNRGLRRVMFSAEHEAELLGEVFPGATPLVHAGQKFIVCHGREFYPVQTMTAVGEIAHRCFLTDHQETMSVVFLSFTIHASLNNVRLRLRFQHHGAHHEEEHSYPKGSAGANQVIMTSRGSKLLIVEWGTDRDKEIPIQANMDRNFTISFNKWHDGGTVECR